MPKKKRPTHRGGAPATVAEPEKLTLPLYIRAELKKMKAAGRWDGDPEDPNLDPAVVLTQLMVDDRLSPELRAVCAKTLLPYFHDDRALMLKAELGPETGQIMVIVKQFSQPGLPVPQGSGDPNPAGDFDARDQAILDGILERHNGEPLRANAAAIDRTRAPGTAYYEVEKGADGTTEVRETGVSGSGNYTVEKDANGYERVVPTTTIRTFTPGTPDIKVIRDWEV